jgi:hypothetical protein
MKTANNFKLDPDDIEEAEETLRDIDFFISEIERCRQFKVGDYLIARYVNRSDDDGSFKLGKIVKSSSYSTPEKFVVVHTSSTGIPFYKQLDVNGKVTGIMYCCIYNDSDINFDSSGWYMELDPDYADAIILDSKEGFNPSAQKKQKVLLYKEITKYNKDNKVNTYDDVELEKFLHTLKPGDIIYRSAKTFYTVQNTEYITHIQAKHKFNFSVRFASHQTKITVVHVVDSKGNEKILCCRDARLTCTNLYKQKPRSYRELSDK